MMSSRWSAVALSSLLLVSCGSDTGSGPTPVLPSAADEVALLDSAFRIDIETIRATLDVDPAARTGRGVATLTFRMRPGQTRPLVHFTPAIVGAVSALRLDGQALDPRADARLVTFEGSPQQAWEIQRDVAAGGVHVLEVAYTLTLVDPFGRFYADVNDLVGRGNEPLFPTLNTPHELAHHVLTLRVHADRPYVGIGSGAFVQTSDGAVQEWVLDSERPIASYTVLFFLAPAADVAVEERVVDGVPVRVMSPVGGPSIGEAFSIMEQWLPELRQALGPFPMPRGMAIVLTSSGGGMEYYGGTVTSMRALRHEVFHMYYGCSTVLRTYRDSWLDEAVNMWYELSRDPSYPAIEDGYRSGIVGGRSPIGVGFDRRAYDQGARIVEAVARELGGRDAGIAFFRELHRTRSFAPFTTMDFVAILRERSGVDLQSRFESWLYAPGATAAGAVAPGPAPYAWLHEVDLTPPPAVRERYDR